MTSHKSLSISNYINYFLTDTSSDFLVFSRPQIFYGRPHKSMRIAIENSIRMLKVFKQDSLVKM